MTPTRITREKRERWRSLRIVKMRTRTEARAALVRLLAALDAADVLARAVDEMLYQGAGVGSETPMPLYSWEKAVVEALAAYTERVEL